MFLTDSFNRRRGGVGRAGGRGGVPRDCGDDEGRDDDVGRPGGELLAYLCGGVGGPLHASHHRPRRRAEPTRRRLGRHCR